MTIEQTEKPQPIGAWASIRWDDGAEGVEEFVVLDYKLAYEGDDDEQ